MEAAGLVLGIAGLFSVCLEVVDRVETYKSSGTQSRQLNARFEKCKLRLQDWAGAVGIVNGELKPAHHARLDVPEVASVVIKILCSICENFEKAEEARKKLRLPGASAESYSAVWSTISSTGSKVNASKVTPLSKRQGIGWTIKGKTQLTDQVNVLEALISGLYETVSPEAEPASKNFARANTDTLKEIADTQRTLKVFIEETRHKAFQQAQEAIDKWLDIRRLDQQYEKYLDDHLEGTCDWILDDPAYCEWASVASTDDAAKFLWMHGPAGHGKSIICARLFQNLVEHDTTGVPCAYLSSTSHVQAGGRPDAIIRYWLSQITRTNEVAFDIVREKMLTGQRAQTAANSEVWSALKSVVENVDHCTFVVDGFDEYDRTGSERRKFLHLLKATVAGTKTRCLIVSRDETDIEHELNENASSEADLVMYECRVSKENLQSDIQVYSDHVVKVQLPKKDEMFRRQLAAEMAVRCEGMFLWIRLQQDQLRGGKGQKALQNIVKSMPSGLNHSYDRNWKSIQNLPEDDYNRAVMILRWVVYAFRPVTIGELTQALLVDPDIDVDEFPEDDLPDVIDEDYVDTEIKTLCCSLIEIRRADETAPVEHSTVHVIHPSVKEYLFATLPLPMQTEPSSASLTGQSLQHAYLAKVCLHYLDSANVWTMHPTDLNFARYAAYFWMVHFAHFKGSDGDLETLVNDFFEPGNDNFAEWVRLCEYTNYERCKSGSAAQMYYASCFGITSAMKTLRTKDPSDIDLVGGSLGTALQAACSAGRREAFDLLLDWGADVNIQGGRHGTALHAAIVGGHLELVEVLIARGANVQKDWYGTHPLHYACYKYNLDIISALVGAGAKAGAADTSGWTPLHMAARDGEVKVAQLLLTSGADVETTNSGGWNALCTAASKGHLEIVRLLLAQDADTTVRTLEGWSPYLLAVAEGHLDVVKCLLEHGVDPSIMQHKTGWTAMHVAANYGRLAIMKFLFERGNANISHLSTDGTIPLHWAIQGGHLEIVEWLLQHGEGTTTCDSRGWSPLYTAVNSGHLEIVQLLLDHGADTSTVDDKQWTLMHVAANFGHLSIMKLLFGHGVGLMSTNKDGDIPLHLAAEQGFLETVKWLLERDCNTATMNGQGWTPFLLAIESGRIDVVEFLLDQGISPSAKEDCGWTPMHVAADYGDLEIMKMLFKRGADITPVGKNGDIPLHVAADGGYTDAVRWLLEQGSEIDVLNENDWTPLTKAICNGHLDSLKLLLQHGADGASPDKFSWTPLHEAAYMGQWAMIEPLLDHGATLTERSRSRAIALRYAIAGGHDRCIDLLLARGADIDAVDLYGRSCRDWLRAIGTDYEDFEKWDTGDVPQRDEKERTRSLIQSIRQVSSRMIKEGKKEDCAGYTELGHCFLNLGMSDAALVAFQNEEVPTRNEEGEVVFDEFACDWCHEEPMKGFRCYCKTCPGVAVCRNCANGTNPEFHRICRNHEFLIVPALSPENLPSQETKLQQLEKWSNLTLFDVIISRQAAATIESSLKEELFPWKDDSSCLQRISAPAIESSARRNSCPS